MSKPSLARLVNAAVKLDRLYGYSGTPYADWDADVELAEEKVLNEAIAYVRASQEEGAKRGQK